MKEKQQIYLDKLLDKAISQFEDNKNKKLFKQKIIKLIKEYVYIMYEV